MTITKHRCLFKLTTRWLKWKRFRKRLSYFVFYEFHSVLHLEMSIPKMKTILYWVLVKNINLG